MRMNLLKDQRGEVYLWSGVAQGGVSVLRRPAWRRLGPVATAAGLWCLFIIRAEAQVEEALAFGGSGCTFWSRATLVNTFTGRDQGYPRVAVDNDGRTLIAWTGIDYGCVGSRWQGTSDVYARIFRADGLAVGAEFRVNDPDGCSECLFCACSEGLPAVAAFPEGGWVVAWQDGCGPSQIFARFLDPEGGQAGEQFPVSPEVILYELPMCSPELPRWVACCDGEWCDPPSYLWEDEFADAVVATAEQSRWAVTWRSAGGLNRSYFRPFEGLDPVSEAVCVTEVFGLEYGTWVAMAPQGESLVATLVPQYDENGNPRAEYHVYLRRYGASGELLAGPVLLDSGDLPGPWAGSLEHPRIAADGQGNFVVVWKAYRTPQYGLAARRYTANLEPLGEPFWVVRRELRGGAFDPAGAIFDSPDVTMDRSGRFVVVWTRNESDPEGLRFAPDGTPVGHVFKVATALWYGSGWAALCGSAEPRVSMNDSGRFVVAYHTSELDPWCDVVARVFDFEAPDFIRGDVTGEGEVNLTDAIAIARYLFSPGSPPPVHPDAADTNDDGEQDIADVVYLLFHLYVGKPRVLPPPYPHWGFDTTEDALGS